jgi:putative transposase
MSRKGDCWDNAPAESFFKTLKTEMVYHQEFKNKHEAKLAIFEFIEVWRPPRGTTEREDIHL